MDKNEQYFLLNEETDLVIQESKTNKKQTDILNNGIQSLNFITGSSSNVYLLLSIPKSFNKNDQPDGKIYLYFSRNCFKSPIFEKTFDNANNINFKVSEYSVRVLLKTQSDHDESGKS